MLEVDPCRHVGRAPGGAAVEEEQLLAGALDRHVLGEQAPEPGAAGPHHHVGLEHAAVVEPRRRAVRAGGGAHQPGAVRDRLAGERADRALRPQNPGLGLVQQVREPGGGVAREQPRARLRREPLVRDPLLLEDGDRLRLPAVLAMREPRQAALDQQLLAALGLELAPERPRAPRRGRVVGIRPVAAADQARLAAGGRARVARLELVDQGHRGPGTRQPPGERRPEHPCTDDHSAAHGREGSGAGRLSLPAGSAPASAVPQTPPTHCVLTTCASGARRRPRIPDRAARARRGGRRELRRVGRGTLARGHARRRSRSARAAARRRLDPRQRDRRTRRDRAAAPARPPRRRAVVARADRQPDGVRPARARTRAASTSTATSRSAGPAAGARSTPTSPVAPRRASPRRARCGGWSPTSTRT